MLQYVIINYENILADKVKILMVLDQVLDGDPKKIFKVYYRSTAWNLVYTMTLTP